ncbi:hypothetical protein ASZ90_003084 [hydrocarbon metagenome]|uniref:Lipoprotein n=1 Tax=hydrocarbon metagenome TaxID=938273 RepID=A0A0W8G216_9ZZZZ
MKRYLKILILPLILIIFLSCEDERTPEKIFYATEINQLTEKTIDINIGITFRAPNNWDLRSSEISKRVERSKGIIGEFVYNPSYIFFDDSTTSVLNLGKVIPPDSLLGREDVLNIYSQILVSKHANELEYEVDQFAKDGIKFTQFSIDQGSIISKRLIFQNKFQDIIQFEFTSKATLFNSEYEKIKQSIGSITLL